MNFKNNFVWGVATSSYQIEGAAYQDGKGLNIWDVFCQEDGRVFENHNGDIACNHYNCFMEDIAIMKSLNIKAYRFSINWSRILPNGTGKINPLGIKFYNDLIDALLDANIEPYITLYHWELPYELHKKGGWLNPQIVDWFGDYAKIIAESFSDRVKNFFTLNEPQCFIGISYLEGRHAPGLKVPVKDSFEMSHNALKAHGMAVIMLRKYAKQNINIGYAPTGTMAYPFSESQDDINAAKEYMFGFNNGTAQWAWNISWWSDSVLLGHYPEQALKKYAKYLPDISKSDMQLISQPLDYYGQNIYTGVCVKMGENGQPVVVKKADGYSKTAFNWPITPEALYWGPKFLYERYKKPIYITENGLSCHDVVSVDGKVHDPNRIDFLKRYLRCLKRAIADGVDVRGYFQWSLLDNFEWDSGYRERFGIVFVDYKDQKRIIKDSGHWYSDVITTNGEIL